MFLLVADMYCPIVTFVHIENPYDLQVQELSTWDAMEDAAGILETSSRDYAAVSGVNGPGLPTSSTAHDNEMDTLEAMLPPIEVCEDVKVFELQLMRHFSQVPSRWSVYIAFHFNLRSLTNFEDGRIRHNCILFRQGTLGGHVGPNAEVCCVCPRGEAS